MLCEKSAWDVCRISSTGEDSQSLPWIHLKSPIKSLFRHLLISSWPTVPCQATCPKNRTLHNIVKQDRLSLTQSLSSPLRWCWLLRMHNMDDLLRLCANCRCPLFTSSTVLKPKHCSVFLMEIWISWGYRLVKFTYTEDIMINIARELSYNHCLFSGLSQEILTVTHCGLVYL